MDLRGLTASGSVNAVSRLEEASPFAARIVEIKGVDEVLATLVTSVFGTPEGTRVTLRSCPGLNYGSLAAAIERDDIAVGDIVGFSSSFLQKGVGIVGHVGARTGRGLYGEIQLMTAMVRLGRMKRSEKAKQTYQYATIADAGRSEVVHDVAGARDFFERIADTDWLGADRGAILRGRGGFAREFVPNGDADIAYLLEEMEAQNAFSNGGLEIIPTWRLSTGREQMYRDGNPDKPNEGRGGSLSSRYEFRGRSQGGFVPSLVVTSDDEEWAFGAPTGRIGRVASSVMPIVHRPPVTKDDIPSAVLAKGGLPNTVRFMWDRAAMAARQTVPVPLKGEAKARGYGGEREYQGRQSAPMPIIMR